jgi:nicotinamide-nucleotide amidase
MLAQLMKDTDTVIAVDLLRALTDAGLTLAIGESCTGGLLAHRVTSIPGASKAFVLGVVTYANEAKTRILGVDEETLDAHGAVSEQTAHEMLEGLLRVGRCRCAMVTTGIAGPTGGTPDKPVGTVYIGAAVGRRRRVERKLFEGCDRGQFIELASSAAMQLLADMVRGEEG